MDSAIITGRNSVIEALKAGRSVTRIYITAGKDSQPLLRIRSMAREKGVPVEPVSADVMRRHARGTHHQDVVAFAAAVAFTDLDEVLSEVQAKGDVPFLILLDGIEDVHNLGAVIRTAECAGAHAVLVPKRRSAPVNETVGKTSAGAVEYMPVVRIGNTASFLKKLKKQGFWVIGADMDGETDYFHSSLTGPLVLVIGSEGKGISRLVREHCDRLVRIPMFGRVNSLNASVAAALLLYEAVRQRREQA